MSLSRAFGKFFQNILAIAPAYPAPRRFKSIRPKPEGLDMRFTSTAPAGPSDIPNFGNAMPTEQRNYHRILAARLQHCFSVHLEP